MAKYKVGDKVLIKSMREMGLSHLVGDMKKYTGKVVTIRYAHGTSYGIDEDGGWSWNEGWFKGLKSKHRAKKRFFNIRA